MNGLPAYIAALIAVLLIVLGFVALLKQKVYIDPDTRNQVEIEVPILGKMKSNYPALLFVFLGVAMACYGIYETRTLLNDELKSESVTWTIHGILQSDEKITWTDGEIRIMPTESPSIQNLNDHLGTFEVKIPIRKGITFEEAFDTIIYSHPLGFVQIHAQKEFALKQNGQQSKLVLDGATTRKYKANLVVFPVVTGSTE